MDKPVHKPLITAAVTCFNAVETIEKAIRSIQSQDWHNLEILIVDDCSTDGSLALIKAMAQNDPRIRIIQHEKNLGVGSSRNSLVNDARGDIVAFFDDDDESQPCRLSIQYERLLKYEESTHAPKVVCYSARTQVFLSGIKLYKATIGMDQTPAPAGEEVANLFLLGRPLKEGGGACATCSLMARKETLVELGFNRSLRRGEDTDFNIRLALMGGHFAGISKPLVTQGMTVGGDKKLSEERKNQTARIELHKIYLDSIGWYDFALDWLNFRFDLLEGKWLNLFGRALRLLIQNPVKLAIRMWWLLLLNWRSRLTLTLFKNE